VSGPAPERRRDPRAARISRQLPPRVGVAETRLYRPGTPLAVVLLLAPAALAVAAAAVALATTGRVPVLLPLLLLAWIPAIPAAWRLMITVRTAPAAIAAALPWGRWVELPWEDIARAERRGTRITLRAPDGRRLVLYLVVLRGRGRLLREILARAPAAALDARLQADARDLLGPPLAPSPAGQPSRLLRTRPRPIWRAGAAVATAGAALLAAWAAIAGGDLATGPRAALGAAAVVVAAGAGALWGRLSAELILSERGLALVQPVTGRTRDIAWDEVQLIEYAPRELAVRLRGDRVLTCAGPRLLPPADREAMRDFLRAYGAERGVPVVARRWPW
jgi:hypothetical protein